MLWRKTGVCRILLLWNQRPATIWLDSGLRKAVEANIQQAVSGIRRLMLDSILEMNQYFLWITFIHFSDAGTKEKQWRKQYKTVRYGCIWKWGTFKSIGWIVIFPIESSFLGLYTNFRQTHFQSCPSLTRMQPCQLKISIKGRGNSDWEETATLMGFGWGSDWYQVRNCQKSLL